MTQRQQKRLEWWKKNNETDDSSKTDVPDTSEPTKKQKLKATNSVDEVSSPAPKRSKTESLKEESGLTDEAIGALRTAKAKKRKIRKEKTEKPDSQDAPGDSQETSSASKKSKLAKNVKAYVLFVGNIPYQVTKEDIEKHFLRTGGVKEVRLLTDKDTGKSKGCAYIDFVDSKSHKFGLRLHESMLGGRKINVEFTSRGRKTPKRTERLKEKNRRMARMKRVFDHASKTDQ